MLKVPRETGGPLRDLVLMAVWATLIVLSGCLALFIYAGAEMNRSNELREVQLMRGGIERGLTRLRADVLSATVSNEAYERAVAAPDPAWLNRAFGAYYHQHHGHDLTIAVDQAGRVIHASRGGESVPAQAVASFAHAAAPLTAQIRLAQGGKLAADPKVMGLDRVASAKDVIRAEDGVYLVAGSTVAPEASWRGPLVAREVVVLSAIRLDPARVQALGDDYGVHQARLLPTRPARGPYVDIGGPGAPAGGLTWKPDLPGRGVLFQARWPIVALGVLLGLVVTALILRVRRLALDLMTARDEAHTADQAKSAFIANVSHEVRTPLNGIMGMAQVMAMDDLAPLQRKRLEVVQEASASLLAILNDVLDMSKIQAGKVELEATSFDIEELARNACAAFSGLALAKDLKLELSIEPRAAGRWMGDPLRLRQVISNLISNAVKFTEAGSVTVRVDSPGAGLVISVVDTGIGLAPEELPKLFAKFSQAETSTTRRFGGTGLGLSICLHLVELMGGRIEAESQKGEGARFTITLPLARDTFAPAPAKPEQAMRKAPRVERQLRILAAEDNASNQLVLKSLLEPLDVSLTMTGDGVEAVAAYEAENFDLVLMDAQMPRMSGADAARAIRAFEKAHGRPRTPMLALSANVMTHQIEEYLAAGMDGHVAKPIDIANLYDAIERAVAEPRATQVA